MKRNSNKPPKDILDAAAQITPKDANIKISIATHKEYIAYHDKIDCEKYDCKKVIEQSKKSLNDKNEDEVNELPRSRAARYHKMPSNIAN